MKIRRALFLTTAERYFTLAVNFLTIAVVSRLLTPEEIGVSVVGTSIATLMFSAQEFAAASFLIQQPNLTREDIRGAFTVMLLLYLLISGAIVVLAPLVAFVYEVQDLTLYLWVLAASCLLELVSVPVVALLKRDMKFQEVALINATAGVVLAFCTVGLVMLGFSYMSFAWAGLLSIACRGVLALFLRPDLWMYRPLLSRWQPMMRFGGYNGASILLYRAYELLPYAMLARILSLDAAAFYNRALMICQIPDKLILGGAVSVILPALSQEVQAGRGLRDPYLRAIEYITGLQWPALLILAVLAEPIVTILLGPQWMGIVQMVQILSLASMFSFTAVLNYPVLLALNAMRDAFLRALIAWPASALIITAAAFFGLQAVAWSFFIIVPLQAYVSLSFIRRHLSISWTDLAFAVRKSAIVAASSVLGPAILVALQDFPHIHHPLAVAPLGVLLAGIGWIAGLWLARHPLLGELLRAMDAARHAAGASASSARLKLFK